MSDTADVAIVGLGPVGAILAALLGQQGIQTIAIDKSDDIYPLPRAIGFDHEIMRILQNVGLADSVAPHIAPYPPTEYHGVGGTVIARYASLPAPYPQGWEPSFVFTQPPFERAIRDSLKTMPSVDVRLSTTLNSLREQDGHVEMEVITASGKPEKLRARYVVGCDGASSAVRKQLNIDFESLDFDEPWLVVDILVNQDKLHKLPKTIVQYCDPARPTSYVLGPGNHRRWEIMLLPGEAAEEMCRDEVIWRLVSRWLGPEDARLWRAASYTFHALVAKEWRRGRVFLAGDSAHMTPPFMAQGMCQGFRDAANLAWKISLVMKGQATDALLDTYQLERRRHVRATTETAKSLGSIICEFDPVKAQERDNRMLAEWGNPPVVRHRQNLIPGLIEGALLSRQGPPVGTRFPQPRVATPEGPRLLDDLVGSSFRLAVSQEVTARDIPRDLQQNLVRLGGSILFLRTGGCSEPLNSNAFSIVETDDVLTAWLQSHQLAAALVRPDHYVFGIARQPSELIELGRSFQDCLQAR